MKRRDFLLAAGLGGSVAGLPLPAAHAGMAPTVGILGPAGSPEAAAFVAALQGAGLAPRRFTLDGGDRDAVVAALGDRDCAAWLGLLEPAGAVVVQQLARDLGLGLRWSADHALDCDGARHHCAATGLGEALAWRDDLAGWQARLAGFYAALITGKELPPLAVPASRPAAAGPALRLASFILTR
jgi:hypothetical protein